MEPSNRRILGWVLTVMAGIILGLILAAIYVALSQPAAMELNLPPKNDEQTGNEKSAESSESKILTLILGEEDKIYYYMGLPDEEAQLDITIFGPDGIRRVILNHQRSVTDPIIVIKPDKLCTYKNVVDILDEMATLEVKKYAMTDITPEDSLLLANTRGQ